MLRVRCQGANLKLPNLGVVPWILILSFAQPGLGQDPMSNVPHRPRFPVFDTTSATISAHPPVLSVRSLYRALQVPPQTEFETESTYRARATHLYVPSGPYAIPVKGFGLRYQPEDRVFLLEFDRWEAHVDSVTASDGSQPTMVYSEDRRVLVRTELRTNAFGAVVRVGVTADTFFGVIPVDPDGRACAAVSGLSEVYWGAHYTDSGSVAGISPDSAQALKPFLAALIVFTPSMTPQGRVTDSGEDHRAATFENPVESRDEYFAILGANVQLLLYDRRSRRIVHKVQLSCSRP